MSISWLKLINFSIKVGAVRNNMADQEETKFCKNCERQIAASKFRMHEIQCVKLNYKCKVCGEVVAKADREEHEAEAHVKKKCQFCDYEELESKFDSNNHEDNCKMAPKACPYCKEVFKI